MTRSFHILMMEKAYFAVISVSSHTAASADSADSPHHGITALPDSGAGPVFLTRMSRKIPVVIFSTSAIFKADALPFSHDDKGSRELTGFIEFFSVDSVNRNLHSRTQEQQTRLRRMGFNG